MDPSQITFNFWIFFSNAVCALALNFSIFLVIGRTGAVTIRVAGVLKDWILIALSTVIFPESAITGLNIIGYAIGILLVAVLLQLTLLTTFCSFHFKCLEIFFCSSLWSCDVQLFEGQGCPCVRSTSSGKYSRKSSKGYVSFYPS